MIAGHYSTSLIAFSKNSRSHLLLFLVAAQLPDFLWFLFHYLGIEPTLPSSVFDISIKGLSVYMVYSHDIIPDVIWSILIFLMTFLFTRNYKVSLSASMLVLIHMFSDLLIGYHHGIFGADTIQLGTGIFSTHPFAAEIFELVYSFIFLFWFFRLEKKGGVQRSINSTLRLISVFVANFIIFGFLSNESINQRFGFDLHLFDFNTSIPSLIVIYLTMLYLIYKFTLNRR